MTVIKNEDCILVSSDDSIEDEFIVSDDDSQMNYSDGSVDNRHGNETGTSFVL
ncbi:hypothetical protein L195_g060526, partial [Trifolium pratense]